MSPAIRLAMQVEAVALAAAGLGLYGWPTEVGAAWPWTLPPLAARFIGASLIGIAIGVAMTVRGATRGALVRTAVIGAGLLLAPLTGLLAPVDAVSGPRLLSLAIAFGAWALVDVAAGGLVAGIPAPPTAGRLPRSLVAFFAIHLAAVTPVGVSMFFVPESVAALWPWDLSAINVRLVGSIFLASIPLSILALRAGDRTDVAPTLAVYATFTWLALPAVAVHFGLFDPARLATWVFLALYVFVAIGATAALAASRPSRREPG